MTAPRIQLPAGLELLGSDLVRLTYLDARPRDVALPEVGDVSCLVRALAAVGLEHGYAVAGTLLLLIGQDLERGQRYGLHAEGIDDQRFLAALSRVVTPAQMARGSLVLLSGGQELVAAIADRGPPELCPLLREGLRDLAIGLLHDPVAVLMPPGWVVLERRGAKPIMARFTPGDGNLFREAFAALERRSAVDAYGLAVNLAHARGTGERLALASALADPAGDRRAMQQPHAQGWAHRQVERAFAGDVVRLVAPLEDALRELVAAGGGL